MPTPIERLRQRKAVQWTLAYIAGAWVVLQVVGTLKELFDWPAAILRPIPFLLAVGLLATLVVAWYHGERGAQRVTVAEAGILLLLVAIAVGGVAFIRGQLPAEAAGPSSSVGRPTAAGATVASASVAVLPFQSLSSDPEQRFFSDGLAEELLNVLSQVPNLRVAARTSSFAFRGTSVPVDSIGRALRVAHVVEGSVRRSGERVRISAQLIDASTGYQLWSGTYDRELKDVFEVQDQISRAIAQQLRLGIDASAPLVKEETRDPVAHWLVLRGMAIREQGTPEAYVEAVGLYREAIQRDPRYARAYALLADRLMWQAYFRYIPRERWVEARDAADRALALDPGLGIAQTDRGFIANLFEWDFARADELSRRSVVSNPGASDVHYARAWLLMRLGQRQEAIAEAARAVELDPLSFSSHNGLALMYLYAGETERAAKEFEAARIFAPESPHVAANLAEAYSQLDRHGDALRAAAQARQTAPAAPLTLAALARVHARAGRRAEAERALAALLMDRNASPYRIATVYAALGDRENTLRMLERAVAERDDHASWLAVAPELDSVRGDPRFARLLRRAGLR